MYNQGTLYRTTMALNMYNNQAALHMYTQLSTGPVALNMYNQGTLYRTNGFKHV